VNLRNLAVNEDDITGGNEIRLSVVSDLRGRRDLCRR
jgi:hypothetical protein